MGRIAERLRGKDFHDIANSVHARLAWLKTVVWYARFFGRIGRKTWMKRPSLLYGPGNVRLGDDVHIEAGVVLYCVKKIGETRYAGHIHIGDRTFLNNRCNVTSAFDIRIGCDVAFGPNVFVCDFDHGYQQVGVGRLHTPLESKGHIVIGDRCWLGANVCVASGVELGDDCVVGANSVVTRSFPPCTVVAGSPAVAIRQLDRSTGRWVSIKGHPGDRMPSRADIPAISPQEPKQ